MSQHGLAALHVGELAPRFQPLPNRRVHGLYRHRCEIRPPTMPLMSDVAIIQGASRRSHRGFSASASRFDRSAISACCSAVHFRVSSVPGRVEREPFPGPAACRRLRCSWRFVPRLSGHRAPTVDTCTGFAVRTVRTSNTNPLARVAAVVQPPEARSSRARPARYRKRTRHASCRFQAAYPSRISLYTSDTLPVARS